MKKIISLVLVICIFALSVSAQTVSEEPLDNSPLEAVPTAATVSELNLKSPSALLIEAEGGNILYENNSESRTPPASITKIMSLILFMEAIENGHFTTETVLSCSESAAALGGSQIWLEVGEQMSVNDLLKAVCIVSANDATVLLAEAVSGSEESFVQLMNKKAEELGMNGTHFVNSTGLDHPDHYTTAHDVAIMACELIRHKKIIEYSTVWMDSLRDGNSVLVNTNKLVRFYDGCIGIKTGTTSGAGYCLAAGAIRDGLTLVSVVMNSPTSADRFADSQKLLNYGFANYCFKTVPAEIAEHTVAVKKGTISSFKAVPSAEFSTVMKKSEGGKVEQTVILDEAITAPVKKGQKVGSINYHLNGADIGQIDIIAAQDVEKLDFKTSIGAIFSAMFEL